jgi:multiple sugar transport system substrate-binding protein
VGRQTVRDGLVRDLTPFINSDLAFREDDFYPGTLERYQWDGGTWALPTTLNYRLIFYDKDAFDEAGLAHPEAGWSWDDLLVAAKALTQKEGEQVSRWGFVANDQAYRLVESRIGALIDDSSDPPVPRFDDSDVVEAVRWYASLYLEHEVMPYPEAADEEDSVLSVSADQVLIDNGQAAMWPDTDILWFLRKQQGNIGVVPFPEDAPNRPANPASTGSLAMSAGTSIPDAAWRLMEYLSRQSLGMMTMGLRYMPARISAAEAGGYWKGLDEELAAAQRYAIDHGYVMREAVGAREFDEALQAIMTGDKAVEDALAEAQIQAEAELLEEATERAGATPAPTFVVAAPAEETIDAGVVTITFVPGLGSLNLEPYRDLAKQFHEVYPDLAVEVKMADFVSGAPDLPAMARASDCFEWYPSFQEPANREAILNLEPFLDADPSFSPADFYPQVLEDFKWQGQLWGLPANVTPFVIEYNRDLFEAAGVEEPTMDWTWDQFLEIAVAMTEGEGENRQYGFLAQYYELNDLLLMADRLGAKLIDEDADPPALTFNDPSSVEAMRWYAGLTTEHEVKPVFITDLNNLMGASTALMEREATINEGRAAMWTTSPATDAVFGQRELNTGTAPLPIRADGTSPGSYTAASGYFISAQTENRQACWQWITYLSDQTSATQGLPARRSVAESDAYRQQVGAQKADAYLASMGDAARPSAFQIFSQEEWLGGAIFWYGQAFGQIVDGEASVEDALDAAQKLADDYRACVVAGDDYSAKAWQACAQEIDPSLPGFLFAAGQ